MDAHQTLLMGKNSQHNRGTVLGFGYINIYLGADSKFVFLELKDFPELGEFFFLCDFRGCPDFGE